MPTPTWPAPAPRRPAAIWRGMLRWLALCCRRHRTRAALGELDAHLRRDLGLTEGEAAREARKPCWRA
ncbi:DUF1127 domain-containing protein [Falsiroseomonas sp.]|uniref:DUF1127 domain-containing protein n=1 Tax=Falsiroseomonas sp. TaxID=2870721 RepID=UPI00271AFF24|nr:DUF1127 domain-containing protein [Falsiroseomonas sp.]MDO9502359.1 DUF1127 domain-containing protein [Falsiroseomonas sp.]